MTANELVLQSLDKGLLTITMNRPDRRNALSADLTRGLVEAARGAAENPEVRAVLLKGAGGTFCVGGDVKSMAAGRAPASFEEKQVTLRKGMNEETKLTVYVGRQERVYRMPAFMAVCDLLYRRGVAGATALLGVDGTAHGNRERASFFSRNAATPMMVIAVGSGTRIARVLPELGGLLRRPLLTLERVQICKRDGKLLCPPSALPGTDQTGMPLWHKLMIYTSEAAMHNGQPVHRAIVRALRAAGVSGATTQRGVWGFHGDHAPHGDRLLQLGRHVPVVTIVIDSPERIATAFAVVDELTAEQGLVTSETVPAMRPAGSGLPQ